RRLAAVALLAPIPYVSKPLRSDRLLLSLRGAEPRCWSIEPTVIRWRGFVRLIGPLVVGRRESETSDGAQRVDERQRLWNLLTRTRLKRVCGRIDVVIESSAVDPAAN